MPVASAFRSAWNDVCLPAYEAGEINNECTLHAMLYAEMRARLTRSMHLVLCEPQLAGTIPDIIVLDLADRSIVAIAELKFERYPKFEGDLEKLAHLARCGSRFPLLLDPTKMQLHSEFGVSPNCILVFAAIGASDAWAVDAPTLQSKIIGYGIRVDRFVALTSRFGPKA